MRLAGQFKNSLPFVRLRVTPSASSPRGGEYWAVIDTGFNGFLWMSPDFAFQIGLSNAAIITDVTTADDTSHTVMVAECHIGLGGRSVLGAALIHPGAKQLLLGTDFLKKAGLRLLLDAVAGTFELTDEPVSPARGGAP